ncbi:hypothetical protein HY57_17370 [Dyella japonica A8]|uniref:Type IV pilus assembly protein PilW n=2 Tax=Dyella japonica TaxID=231455 RepID=A0A075K467_9GAMM|nr:hypothetical protein HY57_17370 [Dyella japonica A8]
MVAMLVGLVVMAGVGSVFLAGQRINRTHRALGDVQESLRMAFELLSRDIRHAGATGCGNRRVANVLAEGPANGGVAWWADWRHAIRGFGGDDPDVTAGRAAGDRLAGQPSLQLLGGGETSFSVASHDDARATFTTRETVADVTAGDIFIACDHDHAAIFKVGSVGARTVGYAADKDNCSAGLGYPTSCESQGRYAFEANATLTRLDVSDWYVGFNTDRGLSLYRLGREGEALRRQEMVRGVSDMQLAYHQMGHAKPFVRAAEVTDWEQVTAVRATLTVQSTDPQAGVDGALIARQLSMTIALRNRVP